MPMRTMHRVNGLMFQDLLRYEKKAREMSDQKDVLAQDETKRAKLAEKYSRILDRAKTMRRSYMEMRVFEDDMETILAALRADSRTPAVCAEAEVVAAVLCAADRNVSLADIHPRTRAAYVLMARSILQKFDVRPK